MNYATLGIIGHVDHGKTSLVKALTGVDTDRLEEEKRRGISIVLGYAHLSMPSGEFGIIDAPGHEKFIRTMIAGAAGSDAVLLVVDVNEGVKPQTVEHVDIAGLLGIRRGVIAITKVDTADSDMIELAAAEIRELVDGTFLVEAPIVPVSAHTGAGLEALRDELDALLKHVQPLDDEGCTYLPIDRVFTMSGHGTVVTGTLRRGSLSIDDEVEIYPQRVRATVRELQTHNASVDRVAPGHRTAVNLRGLEKAELHAGDVLATPESLTPARFLDVELKLLERAPRAVGHNHVVRLLYGTKETYARLHLLDRDDLEPGSTCFAQLKLEDEVAVLNLAPFIIRSYSPMHTIGGGRFLAANSARLKRRQPDEIARLRVLSEGDAVSVLERLLKDAGRDPIELARLGLDRRLSKTALKNACKQVRFTEIDAGFAVHRDVFDGFVSEILQVLRTFHAENPTLRGMTRPQLAQVLRLDTDAALLTKGLNSMRSMESIGLEKGFVFLANFTPEGSMSDADKSALSEIEAQFKSGGLQPPMVAEVTRDDPERTKLYRLLVTNGVLTPLTAPSRNPSAKNNMAFHREALDAARAQLNSSFGDSPFTTAQAKDLLNISRKYLIPVLEHFDAIGVTKRAGEERRLR